jgi:hypothetical protein
MMPCAWKVIATALLVATTISGTPAFAQSPAVNTRGGTSVATETPEQFIRSIADKFGTSANQLQRLLAKIPPHGRGLNALELAVISSRLGLTRDEKAVLKSRVGSGGMGFTHSDIVGMGARLGLNSTQIARLSEQLGLASPTIATRTLFSPAVIEGTADVMTVQPTTVELQPRVVSVQAHPTLQELPMLQMQSPVLIMDACY